jgi:hypothetical protein
MNLARNKPKPPITIKPSPWDHGATGPANRFGLVEEERGEVNAKGKIVNPNGIKGVRRVDMLEFWSKRGTITPGGYNAAIALRAAFENTQRSPGTSFEQDRVDSSPKPDHAVTIQIDRISGFHRINRYLARDDTALVHHVVLGGGTPATFRIKGVRPYHGANYPAGLAELSAALERLHKAMGG